MLVHVSLMHSKNRIFLQCLLSKLRSGNSAWRWVIVEWSGPWGSSGFPWCCFQEVILEVFRIANLCQSFLKMPWFWSEICNATGSCSSGSCHEWSFMLCTAPRRPHLRMADIFRLVVIWGQGLFQIALADFLDLTLFPQTSTTSTCLVGAAQTTSDRATQPLNEVDDHVPTTSELSWKAVGCDWWLVDSGTSFSVISSEAIADNVVNNSHTELGFDTLSCLEASGFKPLSGVVLKYSSTDDSKCNVFFLESLEVAKWFWCRPRFYWRNPRSRSTIKCHLQPVFWRTTAIVGSQSDGVIKCFRFAAPMVLISKNPRKSNGFEVVEAQEVRCQMLHRLIHLPRCQLVTLDVYKVFIWKVRKRRVEIQKRVFRGHFPFRII